MKTVAIKSILCILLLASFFTVCVGHQSKEAPPHRGDLNSDLEQLLSDADGPLEVIARLEKDGFKTQRAVSADGTTDIVWGGFTTPTVSNLSVMKIHVCVVHRGGEREVISKREHFMRELKDGKEVLTRIPL
ncbi:MAG: hypothetical protein KDA91_22025 [Planctomycetaceae bacterium]|nr:hypothetical protein [Planctomycetaceae bacterium]